MTLQLRIASASLALVPLMAQASPQGGHLSAAPQTTLSTTALPTGKVFRLDRRTSVYLPRSAAATEPKRLLVVMGGTRSNPDDVIRMFVPVAESGKTVLVAPHSRDENFDAIENFFDDLDARKASAHELWPKPRFGEDAAALDEALKRLFAATRISPRHIAILGLSHGGSYALSLGTANPQLFGAIAALSPGVLIFQADEPGRQRIFLAHGRHDNVQPFERTARNFVNKLSALGYQVTFEPYDGGHETPARVLNDALKFALNPPAEHSK